MKKLHSKVQLASNISRIKTLRVIYFENSVLGKTLGLVGVTYSNPSDKVETLSLIRAKNSGKHI